MGRKLVESIHPDNPLAVGESRSLFEPQIDALGSEKRDEPGGVRGRFGDGDAGPDLRASKPGNGFQPDQRAECGEMRLALRIENRGAFCQSLPARRLPPRLDDDLVSRSFTGLRRHDGARAEQAPWEKLHQ